jgi:fibronectin type 3 domain-containing protein
VAENDSTTVSWTAVSGATGYDVYIATMDDGGAAKLAATVGGTSYTHTSVVKGKMYWYSVKAVNGAGASPVSKEASAIGGPGGTVTPTVPPAPTDVTLEAQPGRNVVSWKAVSGATSYKVYVSTNNDYKIKDLVGTVTDASFIHTPVVGNMHYGYQVKAVNSAGESDYSTYSYSSSPFGIAWDGRIITYTVEQINGIENRQATWAIKLTFSADPHLQEGDVRITAGTGAVEVFEGQFRGAGTAERWIMIKSITAQGTINVSIDKFWIQPGTKTVTVYEWQ